MPSFIIPARNHPEATARCLSTLLQSVNFLKLKADFILIDDNSEPSERIGETFRAHRDQAVGHQTRIVRAKSRQHYTGVFSCGLLLAQRDVVFFISNDMIVTPSFLQGLLLVSALDNSIGIVRGTSNHTDSHPEHTVVPDPPLKSIAEVMQFSGRVLNNFAAAYVEDEGLSGDAVLLKRSLIDAIGVLDLRFFGYFGDSDYGMRAHLAGFKLVCAKGAWLFHEGGGHVVREATTAGLDLDTAVVRRKELVHAAYQEFRGKWSMDLPESFDGHVGFLPLAREQAGKIPLHYAPPADFLDQFEAL